MTADNTPEVDTRWSHPTRRGVWRVAKVGRKYVTLKSSIPGLPTVMIDVVMWPGSWVKV